MATYDIDPNTGLPIDPEASNAGAGNPANTGGQDNANTGGADTAPNPSPGPNPGGNTSVPAGFDWQALAKQYLTNGSGGMSSFIPAMAQALQQYNNAGKYTTLGQKAAETANPFGDRSYYRDRLRASYDDPSAILNDPGHQVVLQRGMQNVAGQDAMRGYLGSGNMAKDLSKYQSDTESTYLDAERARLANLAGAQFDPANAGKFIMEGGKQSIDSQNAALAAMFTQFNQAGKGGKSTNPTESAPDLVKYAANAISGLSSPGDIVKQLASMASLGGSSAMELWNKLMSEPNVSPATKSLLSQIDPNRDLANLPADGGGGSTGVNGQSDMSTQQWNDYQTYLRTGEFPSYSGGSTGGDAVPNSSIWDDPSSINWDQVDFQSFSPSDWTSFTDYFS
jgi:hypothetical protein